MKDKTLFTQSLVILVVDDSSTSRLLIRRNLERNLNCRIIEATDGDEGFAVTSDEKLDLVITDYNMPNLDGIGLIESIRRGPKLNQRVPIILVSAYLDELPSDNDTIFNVLFIKKPVMREPLMRNVKMALAMGMQETAK